LYPFYLLLESLKFQSYHSKDNKSELKTGYGLFPHFLISPRFHLPLFSPLNTDDI
jgi:hypothetical protein